ncbi:MAG: hypothetical protein QJR06_08200 [Alicyclobacillaceae bacterium]|nr:hypothetical protein [Alicyclobacillaceae bacterium]
MRKWMVAGLAAVAAIGCGAWYAEQIIVEKAGNHIANLLQDPSVQQQVDRVTQDPRVASQLNQAAGQIAAKGSPEGNTGGASVHPPSEASGGNGTASQSSPPPSSPSQSFSSPSGAGGGELVFHSRSEAIRFAMSRFSQAEIARYMSMYLRGMTPEEKRAAKADLLSRFSPAEIRALIAASKLPN